MLHQHLVASYLTMEVVVIGMLAIYLPYLRLF